MRILITGGAGFIGSSLADRLLDMGHTVTIIDDFSTGRRQNVDERVEVLEGSIEHSAQVQRVFEAAHPDVIVHAAASYKDPDAWGNDIRTNVVGTANVVRAAVGHDVRRLIYFQTALCYGTEPEVQPVPLNHPLRPDSSYAITKTAAEQFIALSGLDFVSLRLANCYGPRNVSGPLPAFYSRITAGRPVTVMDTRRDFVFVEDLLDVVVPAIYGSGHGYYHVASGRDYSIKELYEAVSDELPEYRPEVYHHQRMKGDAATILLDPERTASHFGWAPNTDLVEGVTRTIADYRVNGVGETYTHLKVPS